MTQFEQEQLFAEMARAYAADEGAALLREAAELPPAPASPRMDARVRRAMRRRETSRWAAGLSLLAAGFLAVLLVGRPWIPSQVSAPGATSGSPPPSVTMPSTASPGTADSEELGRLIPLGFSLPENLTVSKAEEDRGRSIYHLADTLGDDVVLTMQEEDAPDLTGLRPISLGGQTVYGRSEDGYHLLAFEREGIYYELTCKYEPNTIQILAEQILL